MKRFLLMLPILALCACDASRGMETRTYEVARMKHDDVIMLLTPYIEQGGSISMTPDAHLLTVREKPDRLTVIERLLKQYDGGGTAADVMLDIQVVKADGFATSDSALADIEPTLRQTFKYQGYKLLAQTHVQVREGSSFEQIVPPFQLNGRVDRVAQVANETRVPISIDLEQARDRNGPPQRMESTVTATIGKPTVLGQSTGDGAIILVIRPTLLGN